MALFQASVLKSHLALLDEAAVDKAYKKYQKYFWNTTIQENIKSAKEEQYQATFLNELFVNILGYTLFPNPKSNLTTEFKNEKNARKADGAILKDGFALGVIELKGTNTKDLESIRRQAFDYKTNQKGCVYVITSNFEKLRFYINDATEFEAFDLFTLSRKRFELLYLCLHADAILNNTPLKIKEASIIEEAEITKAFYKDYSIFKRELYRDLVKNNAKTVRAKLAELENVEDLMRLDKNVKLTLFKKSQKLIDRFLFIFFAEDRMLLPSNSTLQILNKWKDDWDFGDERPLYNLFKQYFVFLDIGRKGTEKRAEIYAYNGGLFKPDAILDALEIDSDLLFKYTSKLSNYDFESQVDVNILGHIFENSLNEIESVNAEIEGGEFDKQTSKRKKDGVFYTPKYITKYIVENTVGKLCEEKKVALGFNEADYFEVKKGTHQNTKKQLLETLDTYRDWLLQITICDPACGSGAFLNQALDFLIKEHAYIDELKTKILGGGLQFPDIENTILENNIYGVDLNEESVEIAKLSLWLRTAQPRRKLNDLSSNIKCGNSLIDDKKVAGDKAFNWAEQFPQVFKPQHKKAYHIKTAIHDSRTSDRMVKYKVRQRREMGTNPYPNVIYFTPEDDLVITRTIAEIVKEDHLNLIAYNICADHIHLLLVCDIKDVPSIMQKIKAITAKHVNREREKENIVFTREHAPLQEKKKKKKRKPLWQQKYSMPKEITSARQMNNTINYIQNNRSKHELPEHSTEIQDIIKTMCVSEQQAFKTEHSGGFDVVIGNPPYVNMERLKETSAFLDKQDYKTFNKRGDLYCIFVEKAFQLTKANGIVSYIMPNKWLQANYGRGLRELFLEKNLVQLIDFGDFQIFEGATTYPCIFVAKNQKPTNEIKVSVLQTNESTDFMTTVLSVEEKFAHEDFSNDTWTISSKSESDFLKKLSLQNVNLFDFVKGGAKYGIKTGLTEAFLISQETKNHLIHEHSNAHEHIFPFLQGRGLKAYVAPEIVSYLILFEKGFTKNILGECSEEEGWEWLKTNYPSIAEWLFQFKAKAKKRTDQGDFWWELRACDYYDLFLRPKLMYQVLQVKPCFIYDDEGLYSNNSMWIIPTDNKQLLGILNSKMGWWLMNKYCTQIQNGVQLIWKYFGQVPIPKTNNPELEIMVNEVIQSTSVLNDIQGKFQRYFSSSNSLEKLSRKLESWHELSFATFIKELNKAIKSTNKQRVKDNLNPVAELTKKDEFEWMELFEDNKKKANALQTQITQTENEIDQMVYKLYGLTEEEIGIVEGW